MEPGEGEGESEVCPDDQQGGQCGKQPKWINELHGTAECDADIFESKALDEATENKDGDTEEDTNRGQPEMPRYEAG